MKEKSLIAEQRDILGKYLEGFKLSYYETLVVQSVLVSMVFATNRNLAKLCLESEVKD